MKKIFLLFSAFIASASLLASNSKLPTKVEWNITDSSSHWNDGEKHRIINLDDHVKVFAQNGTNNGNCIGTPATSWATYHTYDNGILTLSALDGYWIEDFKATYIEVTNAILGDTAGDYKTKIYKSEDIIKVSNTNRMWYTASTSTGNGRLQFTNFTVNYYQIPTSITLTSATLAKGGTTTLTPTITPTTASDSLTWTTSDETVATVDNNGKVTAKATGYANIFATGIDGIVKGGCVITVSNDNSAIVETFNSQDFTTSATEVIGAIATWTTSQAQHGNYTKLNGGAYAVQLQAVAGASITSTNFEGGIKRVSFLWNKASKNNQTANFFVAAGGVKDTVEREMVTGNVYNIAPDIAYFHEFAPKSNAQLSIQNITTTCHMSFGHITIVPYLLYTSKNVAPTYATLLANNFKYTNTGYINNTGVGMDKPAIQFEILGENADKIATIDANTGEVTVLGAGTVTVKATWTPSAAPEEKISTTYELTTPEVGEGFVETFDSIAKGSDYILGPVACKGNGGVYSWSVKNYKHIATGLNLRRVWVEGTDSIWENAEGYVATDGDQEGGIKSLNFDWISKAPNPVKFTVNVDGTDYVSDFASSVANKTYTYGRACNIKKNTNFSITLNTASKAHIVISSIKVVPYLLYTLKSATIQMGETYTNTNLLDNRDDEVAIQYSVLSGSATIDANGEVTPTGTGEVTIQAKWGNVTTTYQLTVEGAAIALDETADNATIISENAGQTVNVTTNRSITGGMYNTICLPFDVDAEQMTEVFGANYQLAEFTGATLNDDVLTIQFNKVTAMEAGKPYLIKTTANKSNIAFNGVEIVNTTGASLGSGISMYGVVSPKDLEAGNKTHLIVVADNQLSWVTNGDTENIKGMRAYFKTEGQMQAALRQCNPRLVLNDTNTPTGMVDHNDNDNQNCKVMINGQLIIIRDGVKYNAQGQTL